MQLVATKKTNYEFFRAQSVIEEEIESIKVVMISDAGEELIFQTMTEPEFEEWLTAQ